MEAKKQLVELTQKLVSIKSTADRPGELKKVMALADRFLANKKIFKKKFIRNNKVSAVYTFRKTKEPKIMMVGHLDVVPAPDHLFKATTKGDCLMGRGVEDMKGMDAAMILAMKEFSELKNPPSVGLMLTTDEEIGGYDGVSYLFNEMGYNCQVGFIPDAGRDFNIIFAQKGILHLRITANGKGAHGSRPWLGDNALDKLVDVCQVLRKVFPGTKKDAWVTTCSLGRISGGTAANVVPDQAEMLIDIRFTEEHSKGKLLAKIKKLFPKLKVEEISGGEVLFTETSNNYLKSLKKIIEKELGRKIKTDKSHGASDGRFLAGKNIPVLLIGPTGGGTHALDEWVSIKSLVQTYRIVKNFVLEHGY